MHDDSKDKPESQPAPETDSQKKLTEALLAEYARAGADADEAFVAGVDKAIDSPAAALHVATPPVNRGGVASWWRAAAILIASGLIVGIGVNYSLIEKRKQERALAEAYIKKARADLVTKVGELNAALASKNEEMIAAIVAETKAKEALVAKYESELKGAEAVHIALKEELDHILSDVASSKDLLSNVGTIDDLEKQNDALKARLSGLKPAPNSAPNPLYAKPHPSPSLSPAPAPMARPMPRSKAPVTSLGSGAAGSFSRGAVTQSEAKKQTGAFVSDFRKRDKDILLKSFRSGEADAAPVDRERYGELVDNRWQAPDDYPLSTFSIDVDTASYTNLRRMIRDRAPIPKDSVRIEEMINYFDYDYPEAEGEHPFAFAIETASCPWNEDHRLVRVGLKGKSLARDQRPAANLVFLLDVSGSMNEARKLPLVVDSMKILVEELDADDVVSIVVYAGAEGLALPPTRGSEKKTILDALDRLKAGGSTNGGAGIELAYKTATENFIEDGVNRVILCTDGDFNVGRTVQGDLVDMVKERARGGTFLSVLGFGTGNINDSMLESITNKGNGTYYYIDSIAEGRKVFLEDLMATLVTIAKDVKIQVEFNPAKVESYRLIGYANRMLEAEDFEDDTVDAGEVGAGHRVTALYEIVPAGLEESVTTPLPDLKYQKARKTRRVPSDELLTVKLRYKEPDGDFSKLLEAPVVDSGASWKRASDDFQFASAVALFGMILRESPHMGDATLVRVIEAAAFAKDDSKGHSDRYRRREEFRELVSLKIAGPRKP